MNKHCDTCRYSYYTVPAAKTDLPGGEVQLCSSPDYNSPNYTHEMLVEDWAEDHCRFWAPKNERSST